MSIFRKDELEFRIDTQINNFCSTLKSDIIQSKYKQVIQNTEKFIERECRNIASFSRDSIIYLLYLQSYCCHKIMLKLVLNNSGQSSTYRIKDTFQIMIRNLSKSVQLIWDFLQNRQMVVNFGGPGFRNRDDVNFPSDNYSEISNKSYSYFLETSIWLIKDISIMLNLKKNTSSNQYLLKLALNFIKLTQTIPGNKKLLFRVTILQVKCLITVFYYKQGHNQKGYNFAQKCITEIYQFLFYLNHKAQLGRKQKLNSYRRAEKKCHKLLFIVILYQTYFHININCFHSLQALVSILNQLQTLQGPKQLIRYYRPYKQILKDLTTVVQVHEEFNIYFGNGEIYSVNLIYNIIENSDKVCVNAEADKKYGTNASVNGSNGNCSSSVNMQSNQSKSGFKGGKDREIAYKTCDGFLETHKNTRVNRVSEFSNQNKTIKSQKKSTLKKTWKSIQELPTQKKVVEALVNLDLLKKETQGADQCQVNDENISNQSLLNSSRKIEKKKKTVTKQQPKILAFESSMMLQKQIKEKFKALHNKIHTRKTFDIYTNEQISSSKQSPLHSKQATHRQTEAITKYYQSTDIISSSNKGQSYQNFKTSSKRPKKISQSKFALIEQGEDISENDDMIWALESQEKKTVYDKLISILLRNKAKLSIKMYANKVDLHLKKQQIKKLKLLKQSREKQKTLPKRNDRKLKSMHSRFYLNNTKIDADAMKEYNKLKEKQESNNIEQAKKNNLSSTKQKESSVNFMEIIQQINYTGKYKYNTMRKSQLESDTDKQNQDQNQGQQKTHKPKYKYKTERSKLNNTSAPKKPSRFVSKYENIGNAWKTSCEKSMNEEQLVKMLDICYKKSRQSIEEVTKKIALQKKYSEQNRKRALRKSQLNIL